MTIDLEKLQALCDDATPGPWTFYWGDTVGADVELHSPGSASSSRTICELDDDADYGYHEPDGAFIAAAREAMPALIARVRELEAALAVTSAP